MLFSLIFPILSDNGVIGASQARNQNVGVDYKYASVLPTLNTIWIPVKLLNNCANPTGTMTSQWNGVQKPGVKLITWCSQLSLKTVSVTENKT